MEYKEYQEKIKEARGVYNSGNIAKAIELFELAMEEFCDVDDALDLGLIYSENKQFVDAKRLIEGVIREEDNEYDRSYYCLGYIFDENGMYEEALINYKKAYSINKNSKYAFAIARMLDEVEDKSAIDYYLIALSGMNDDYWVNLNVGSWYERNAEYDKALEFTLKAYTISQTSDMVNYNLGVIYSRLEQYDKSLHHYLKELECKKPYELVYYNLGILYKDIYKDYDNSKYYYLKGIQNNKDNLNLWYNLGCLNAIYNNYKDAYQCFLYVKLKKKEVVSWIEKDPELVYFIKSEEFEKLKNE